MPFSRKTKRVALGIGMPFAVLGLYVWASCAVMFLGNAGWLSRGWYRILRETVFMPLWWYTDSGLPGSKWLLDFWGWLTVVNDFIER